MMSFLSLLVPTKDQMTSYIRTGFKWAGSSLVTHGVAVSPDLWSAVAGDSAVQVYTGIAMALIPVIFDRLIHSDAGKLAAASALAVGSNPVIEKIKTLATAPAPIQAVADDKNVPGVVPAAPLPFVSSTIQQRR